MATSAAAIDQVSEELFLDDVPVVLSATRLMQPVSETPVAMTVIDRRTIELSGARDIPDLLRLVPGFQVGRVTGSRATVTYHGLSDEYARNMQVLIDGRSVYDPGFGGVPWFDLPVAMDDVQRIEVIRGPNSATYGANAFSATINIVTDHPSKQTGEYARLSIDDDTILNGMLRHADSHDRFSYRLSLRYDESEGLTTRHDDSYLRSVDGRVDYQASAEKSIMAKFGFFSGSRQDGFSDPGSTNNVYQPQRTSHDVYHYQQIRLTHTDNTDHEWILHFYHNYLDIDDDFETIRFSDFFGIPSGTVGDPGWPLPWDDQRLKLGFGINSHRYDVELQQTLRPADPLRLVWGVGGRYDVAKSLALFGTSDRYDRYQLRAFVNGELRLGSGTTVNMGVMLEKYTGLAPRVSPRAAFNFRLSPHHSFRISATKAIRVPTLLEEHFNYRARFQDETAFDFLIFSPGDLDPETIRSYEIGYIGTFPKQGLTFDIKLYRDEIRNILWEPDDRTFPEPPMVASNPILGPLTEGASVIGNNGYADIRGWEAAMTFRPSDRLLLRVAIARAHAIGKELKALRPDIFRLLNDQAPHTGISMLIGYEFSNCIAASLVYNKIGPINWRGEGNRIPGYHRVDMRVAKELNLLGKDAKISLTLQNLENEYLDFQEENLQDRRAFLDFSLRF